MGFKKKKQHGGRREGSGRPRKEVAATTAPKVVATPTPKATATPTPKATATSTSMVVPAPASEYEKIRAANIAEREAMFKALGIQGLIREVKKK